MTKMSNLTPMDLQLTKWLIKLGISILLNVAPDNKRQETEAFYERIRKDFVKSAKLSEEENHYLNTTKSPEDIIAYVEEVKRKRETKEQRHRIRLFINKFRQSTLEKLQKFSQSIDALVTPAGAIGGLVWGSIKMVLVVSMTFSGLW